MAGGAARAFDRAGKIAEAVHPRSAVLFTAIGGEAPLTVVPAPVPAPPAKLETVLSPSSDLLGLRRAAWLGAGALYSSALAAIVLVTVPVAPPEPWLENPAEFQVVFEPPPAAAAEPVEESPAPVEPPPTVSAAPETESVLPEPAARELPPVTAQPPAQPLPSAPPRKPTPPSIASKPVAPVTSPPAPAAPPSAGEQVEVLPPPMVELPMLPPRPVGAAAGNAKPDYPAEARWRGQQGRVLLHVEVSVAGAPLSVTIATSSGHQLLDRAARRAVIAWRFTPATRGGAPVAGAVDVPVQFRLED